MHRARYLYRIANRRAPLTLDRGRAWQVAQPLDADAMHRAAQALVGHHDFTTFRSAHCQAASAVKTLDRLDVRRDGETVLIEAEARSFLHHQVRSMVGCLALVGQGRWNGASDGRGAGGAGPRGAGAQCAAGGAVFCGGALLNSSPLGEGDHRRWWSGTGRRCIRTGLNILLACGCNVTFAPMNQMTSFGQKSGRLKLTVEDFLRLDKKGAFGDHKKVELIEGEIWIVSPQLDRHSLMQAELTIEIGLALRKTETALRPRIEASTRLSDYSLPQPDIALANYSGDGVLPLEHVALIVEVSNTTLRTDLGRKLRLYAEAGVPEYWVVDLKGGKLHQMWSA